MAGKKLLARWCNMLLALAPAQALAQEVSEPEEFLQGAWLTDPANGTYAVSSGLPSKEPSRAIRFYSAYSQDQVDVSHTVTTERGISVATIPESSGAIIEGKDIELRQNPSAGTMAISGGWKALVQPVAADKFHKVQWGVYPKSVPSLILDLAVPKQFVLTYIGHSAQSCKNGRLKITVDGKVLKYRSGSEILMPAGTSIWSYGKAVSVTWDGNCQVPDPPPVGAMPLATGTIKLAY